MSLTKRYAPNTYPAETITALDGSLTAGLASTVGMPSEETAVTKHLSKVGLPRESFAREALLLAKDNPDLMPRGLDLARMERTIANRDLLQERLVQAEKISDRLRTAVMLHGVDALSDGLDVYNALQRHGTDATLREAVARLGRLFKKSSLKDPAAPGSGTGTGSGTPAA